MPRWIRTSSYDPVSGTVHPVEEAWFAYDDGGTMSTAPTAGLLTIQEVCGGLPGANLCAEKLTWEFDRTARGAVTEIRAPAGRDTFFSQFAFGETVALEENNALWPHATVRQVDDLGRIWEEVDPNGVGRRTHADAFGRTTRTEVRGAGAAAWRVETEVTYEEATAPNYVQTERTTYLADGSIDTVLSEYELLDGFGDVLQTWAPADTGFIVQETERDARGNVRLTTEPHRETTFSTDYASTRSTVLQSWGYFDLFGDPLLTWSIASGATAFEHPQPSSTIAFMEEYYEKEEVHDSLGRLVEVWQGQPTIAGPLTRTGLYAYDGRDRVRSFTDAAGNVHEYDLDGAGRTRQVWRTPAGGVTSPYFGFVWSGPDPIEMYEGVAGSGALVVEWYYDALGRTEQKDVYDPLIGSVLSWTWEWDEAAGKPTWYGARQRVTDPSGFVSYTYDPDPVFGGFGWPTDLTRTWTTIPSKVVSFDFTYDYAGRVVQQTWPSGAVVDHSLHANGWPLRDDVTAGGTHVQVTHGYDAYGLPDDWTVDLNTGAAVWTQDLTRANSQQPSHVQWTESPTGFTQSLLWTWLDNGWLHQKHGIFPEPITYGYDDLSRITSVHSGTLGMLETYSYDLGHNPVEHYRRDVGPAPALVLDDVWTYDPAPQFNEVPSRKRPLPPGYGATHVVEDFTYDPATSRLVTWDTDDPVNGDIYRDFVYDGAGHLQQMTRNEPAFTQVTWLYHDVDDDVVYELRSRNGVSRHIWRFNGWKEESTSGRVIEQVLPMVRLDGGSVRVVLAELDGHALRTRSSTGAQTFEVLGAYGMPVIGVGSAVSWGLDHMHGGEPDRDDEIMHFGARHLVLRDGLWMQPEPLLHLGLTNGDLSNPIGFSGLYSAGNTNIYQDRSGYMAATTAALVVTTTTYSWTSIGVAAGGAVQSAGSLGIGAASAAGATGLATAFATANKALSDATTAIISSVGNTPLGADVTIPSIEVVPLDTASASEGGETKPEAGRQKGDRARADESQQAKEDQFREIESAQRKYREGKSDTKIDNIDKSRQRADHELSRIKEPSDLEEDDYSDIEFDF